MNSVNLSTSELASFVRNELSAKRTNEIEAFALNDASVAVDIYLAELAACLLDESAAEIIEGEQIYEDEKTELDLEPTADPLIITTGKNPLGVQLGDKNKKAVGKQSLKRWVWIGLGTVACALVIAAGSFSIGSNERGREAEKITAELNQRLQDSNRESDLQQRKLQGQIRELNRKLTISDARDAIVNEPPASDTNILGDDTYFTTVAGPEFWSQPIGNVQVTVQNDFLPAKLSWQVGIAKEEVTYIPVGTDQELVLPAGHAVSIICNPRHTSHWIQPYGIVIQRKGQEFARYLGSAVGKTALTLEDGDRIRIIMDPPSPPWNATMFRVDGHLVLLTLHRPNPEHNVPEYRSGQLNKFPNAMMAWSKVGSAGLARELAQQFERQRADANPGHSGRFDGNFGIGLVVQAGEVGIGPDLKELDIKELEKALVAAFEVIRKKHNSVGEPVEAFITKAGQILRQDQKLNEMIDKSIAELLPAQ
jgi:hypothetical protein